MAGHIVIYDGVAYTTGSRKTEDLEYHTLARGDEVPDEVDDKQLKRWLDPEVHPPHGAVAKKGSRLAGMLSSPVSIASDPSEARRRISDAAGEEEQLLLRDPAGEPTDKVQTGVDPGVASQREVARRTQAARAAERLTADQTAERTAAGAEPEQLEDMSKSDLQDMADGLGVEYAKADSKAELAEKIRAHQQQSAQQPSGS